MQRTAAAVLLLALAPGACVGTIELGAESDLDESGEGPGGRTRPADGDQADAGRESEEIYLPDALPGFEIEIAQEDWDWLNQNSQAEEYRPATFRFEDEVVEQVGVRFKGSCGSLLWTQAYGKFSVKVEFDEYVPGQRWRGLEHLVLNASRADPTMLRERLSYHLFRELSVPASRANHALLSVNGQPRGVYVNIEAVDDPFLSRVFGDNDGLLYKEAWPMSRYAQAYLETVRAAGYQHGAGGPAPDVGGMVALAETCAAASDEDFLAAVSPMVDPDSFLRFQAVERAVSNWDGTSRFYRCLDHPLCFVHPPCRPDLPWRSHNYYWYQDTGGRFHLIPWDLDHTFERDLPADFMAEAVYPDGAPSPLHPRMGRLAHDRYLAALEELLAGPLEPDTVGATLDAFAAAIEPHVSGDPEHGGQGVEGWRARVEELRGRVLAQRAVLERYLCDSGGTCPAPAGP